MTMKNNLILALVAGLSMAGVLRADDSSATAASPSAATDSSAAAASPTAATVAPNDAPGSLKAGKELLTDGKFEEAVAYFNGIGEQVADNGATKREPYRQLDLASAYLNLAKYQDAEDAANKAIALMKDLEPAWNDLGAAQVNSGNRADAIATYTKGIAQLNADNVDSSRLAENLKTLQIAAGITPTPTTADQSTTDTAAAAPVSPAAAQ
jgi:tetratricopeptide (TPR) repeat protein